MKFYFKRDLSKEQKDWVIIEQFPDGLRSGWAGSFLKEFYRDVDVKRLEGPFPVSSGDKCSLIYDEFEDIVGLDFDVYGSVSRAKMYVLIKFTDTLRGAWVEEQFISSIDMEMEVTSYGILPETVFTSGEFTNLLNKLIEGKYPDIGFTLMDDDVVIKKFIGIKHDTIQQSNETTIRLEVNIKNLLILFFLKWFLPQSNFRTMITGVANYEF